MLISPYTQQVLLRPVTLASQCLLVFAIVLGSTAPLEMLLELTTLNEKIHTVAWLLVYLCALGGLFFAHGINWITWLTRYRILLVFLLIGALLTIPWSVDPGLSFNRTVHLLGTSVVGIYLGFAIPPAIIMRLFAITLALLMALCAIAVYVMPEFALEVHNGTLVWKGILDNKNTLGFWAATGVLLYPWFILQSKNRTVQALSIAALVLCMVIVIQSRSAGSLIALTVAIAAIVYLLMSQRLQLGVFAMTLLAIMITILVSLMVSGIDVAAATGRSTDLTGRTEIWQQTWRLIEQRPLMGYGYGTLWTPTEDTLWIQKKYTDFTWTVYHAHNGLLQTASEVGLPLTAIALLFVVQQLVETIHCQYRKHQTGAIFTVGFIIAYLVSNYSEARFLQSRELFWLFFLALPISLIREVRIKKPAEAGFEKLSNELDDRRLRYPDEIIPAPKSKLKLLQESKRKRQLSRVALRLVNQKSSNGPA